MIGRLGTTALSAVGLGNQLFFLLNLILYGLASGSMVFTAQFWGKKNLEGLQKTFGLSLLLAFCLGALFTVFCVLKPAEILSLYTKDRAVIESGTQYLRLSALCFLPFAVNFMFMLTLRSIEKVKVCCSHLSFYYRKRHIKCRFNFRPFGFSGLGCARGGHCDGCSPSCRTFYYFYGNEKTKIPHIRPAEKSPCLRLKIFKNLFYDCLAGAFKRIVMVARYYFSS